MAFKFIKNQLLKVIEYTDDTKNTLVYKFPMEGREIMNGSALTVRESQVAVFVHKGEIADVFEPGYYKLKTENLPVLTKLMSWKYGFDSPFKAECYFVNTKQFTDQKWGTINPIMLRDPDFGMVRLRGFGKYSFRVVDAALLMKELFGTNSSFKTEDVSDYIRSNVVQSITDALGESQMGALDMAANYREMSAVVTEALNKDFAPMGIAVPTVVIENISLPEEVEKNMDTRTSMGIMGDKMGTFMQFQAAHAMRDAAQNTGGGLAGAGMGLGAGLGIGNVFSQAVKGNIPDATPSFRNAPPAAPSAPGAGAAETAVCGKCGASVKAGTKFCPECGEKIPVEKFCTNCGAKCAPGAKFCAECGEKL